MTLTAILTKTGAHAWPSCGRILAALLVGCIGLIGGDTLAAPTSIAEPESPVVAAMPAPRHPREMTYIKRKWGVEILFIRETAAGHMLEFRYKVLDPEKAKPLFIRKTKPVLTDVKTGHHLGVPTPPKTGALRNSDVPLADHTYWMFFSNPGKIVRPGDLVNLRIGDFAIDGLIVQE